eukprot:1159304-Pelagomonas_calceolata.AAC.10
MHCHAFMTPFNHAPPFIHAPTVMHPWSCTRIAPPPGSMPDPEEAEAMGLLQQGKRQLVARSLNKRLGEARKGIEATREPEGEETKGQGKIRRTVYAFASLYLMTTDGVQFYIAHASYSSSFRNV